MSITYEQALGTLTAMFKTPWTEDSLDTVLRHFEGHMENTVDAVLTHGDGDPQLLIQRLESGTNQEELDEQLARELANGTQQQHTGSMSSNSNNMNNRNVNRMSSHSGMSPSRGGGAAATNQSSSKKGRGIVTSLPDDFLRIPGNNGNISSDEALARMLQDKLFADELRNNPEFAHLAQGGRANRNFATVQRGRAAGNQNDGPNIMEALGSMGENAKRRLQELANKVKTNINNIDNNARRGNAPFRGGGGASAERRGLLDLGEDDDDEQEISFVSGASGSTQQRTNYEMRDFDKKRD